MRKTGSEFRGCESSLPHGQGSEERYLYVADLRDRGWTEALVRRFLGAPEVWAPVDHFLNYTGKKAWRGLRVMAIESMAVFQGALAASARRRGWPESKVRDVLARFGSAPWQGAFKKELEAQARRELPESVSTSRELLDEGAAEAPAAPGNTEQCLYGLAVGPLRNTEERRGRIRLEKLPIDVWFKERTSAPVPVPNAFILTAAVCDQGICEVNEKYYLHCPAHRSGVYELWADYSYFRCRLATFKPRYSTPVFYATRVIVETWTRRHPGIMSLVDFESTEWVSKDTCNDMKEEVEAHWSHEGAPGR